MHDLFIQLLQLAGTVGIASLSGLAAAAGRQIWHATESIKDENKRRAAETGLAAVGQAAEAGSSLLAQQGTLLGTLLASAIAEAVKSAVPAPAAPQAPTPGAAAATAPRL